MKKFLVAIDQGTTSSRAILFSLSGKPIYTSQKEFTQYFPKDGWVEHNPNEIWNTTRKVLTDVIAKSKKLEGKILTIGITNQRETTILWDKKTGKHIYNAIVWQDRRTAEFCKKLKSKKKEKSYNKRINILIDNKLIMQKNKIFSLSSKGEKYLKIIKICHSIYGIKSSG